MDMRSVLDWNLRRRVILELQVGMRFLGCLRFVLLFPSMSFHIVFSVLTNQGPSRYP